MANATMDRGAPPWPIQLRTAALTKLSALYRQLLTSFLLLFYCGFLFFYGLSQGDFYRSESLRAIIAAEFLSTGNWIVPTLYGQPLFTKPPGMYAAIALCSWPWGQVTEWSARLPSALAGTAVVFMMYGYFRRQLGELAGLLAGLITPASLMWLDKVPTAEIDALQTAWVTAALLCFFRAVDAAEASEESISRWWWIGALLCVAGGFLTKWTSPAFFYSTVLLFLWRRCRLPLLIGRGHLAGIAFAATVVLAWIAAVALVSDWPLFVETVGREAFMRLSPVHHHRSYPWFEVLQHPFKILAACLPWSAFTLWTLRGDFGTNWDARGRFLLQSLHCWLWPNLIFWSVTPEHASRHGFPMFPAVAGLAVCVWWSCFVGEVRWPTLRMLPKAGTVFVGLLMLCLLAKLIFVQVITPNRNQERAPREKGRLLAGLIPAGQPLFVFEPKDEGIMFYFGGPVVLLNSLADLPVRAEPLYCILDKRDWLSRPESYKIAAICHLNDEQGQPIVLVRVAGSNE